MLKEVLFGIDEGVNTQFAVELRANGHDLPTEEHMIGDPQAPDAVPIAASARLQYTYRPPVEGQRYWHPYLFTAVGGRRRFVQGRLADLEANPPRLFHRPVAEVLYDKANLTLDSADQVLPAHHVQPTTILRFGLRLQRQWMLAPDVDDNPGLWVRRRRLLPMRHRGRLYNLTRWVCMPVTNRPGRLMLDRNSVRNMDFLSRRGMHHE